MSVRQAILFGGEDAAQRGLHPEHGEIRPGDELRGHPLRLRPVGQVRGGREAAEHAAEDLVVPAQVLVQRVGEGVEAPVAAVVAAFHSESDQLLRVLDGQAAQQHLVEQGEDRGVGPDADGQREDRHQGEAGRLEKPPEGVPDVLQHSAHQASPRCLL